MAGKLQKYIAKKTQVSAVDMNSIEARLAALEAQAPNTSIGEGAGVLAQQSEQFRIMQLVSDLPPGGCGYAVPIGFNLDSADRITNSGDDPIFNQPSCTYAYKEKVDGDSGIDMFREPVYEVFNHAGWPQDRGLVVAMPGDGAQRPCWIPIPYADFCLATNPVATAWLLSATDAGNPQEAGADFRIEVTEYMNTNSDLFEVTLENADDPVNWDLSYNILIKRQGIYDIQLDISATASQSDDGTQPLIVKMMKGCSLSYAILRQGIIGFSGGSCSLQLKNLLCEENDGVQMKVTRTAFDSGLSEPGVNYTIGNASLRVERQYNRHFYNDGAKKKNESYLISGAPSGGWSVHPGENPPEYAGRGDMCGDFKEFHNVDDDLDTHGAGYPRPADESTDPP